MWLIANLVVALTCTPGMGAYPAGAVQSVEPAILRQQWIGFDLDRSIGRSQRIDDVLVTRDRRWYRAPAYCAH